MEDGYFFKNSLIVNHTQGFADDLSVMTSTPERNQKALDIFKKFLVWTRTMKENIKKCVSMAMKRFDDSSVHRKNFDRLGNSVYCPFDPDLNIGGAKLRFIVDVAREPGTLAYDHFKELGRWISVDLKEDKIKSEVHKRVLSDLTVDSCGINGFSKLCMSFLWRRVSWQFLVHDFCLLLLLSLTKSESLFSNGGPVFIVLLMLAVFSVYARIWGYNSQALLFIINTYNLFVAVF